MHACMQTYRRTERHIHITTYPQTIIHTCQHALNLYNQVPPSPVAAETPTFAWEGKAIIGATTHPHTISQKEFIQVQQAWVIVDQDFDKLLDAYKKATKNMRQKPSLREWKIPPNVLRQWPFTDHPRILLMQTMSRRCKVGAFHHIYVTTTYHARN